MPRCCVPRYRGFRYDTDIDADAAAAAAAAAAADVDASDTLGECQGSQGGCKTERLSFDVKVQGSWGRKVKEMERQRFVQERGWYDVAVQGR